MKLVRLLVAAMTLAGACLIGRAAYMHAKAELAAVLIHCAWEESVRLGKASPPWPWADTQPVARLLIPRLGYDEIVLEGASPRTLAFGPARLLSGARLGEPGNLEVAGHRTSWFRPLEALRTGDNVEVQWFDAHRGQLRQRYYTVESIHIVLPEEVGLLAPTSEDALTLITCYPFGHSPRSPQRYVVRALPTNSSHATGDAVTAIRTLPSKFRGF